ncbi:hypothetical protein EV192_1263 [Actinocrispum wychmicini]|uniref:Uncharacterized protein n=1 Tax=Actinocrispum wychmicini TaxID=1213861 RepID=A0A4R2IJ13_9PSEU|nr:hypothetical protein EV192_1263 [Actinocrispum wychmicini]
MRPAAVHDRSVAPDRINTTRPSVGPSCRSAGLSGVKVSGPAAMPSGTQQKPANPTGTVGLGAMKTGAPVHSQLLAFDARSRTGATMQRTEGPPVDHRGQLSFAGTTARPEQSHSGQLRCSTGQLKRSGTRRHPRAETAAHHRLIGDDYRLWSHAINASAGRHLNTRRKSHSRMLRTGAMGAMIRIVPGGLLTERVQADHSTLLAGGVGVVLRACCPCPCSDRESTVRDIRGRGARGERHGG